MQKLSIDPLVFDEIDPMLRDSVQLNLQKIQDYVNLLAQSVNPTGTIIGLESATAPPGYLLANGSTFVASTYPDLNSYLGGNTLPDYRGKTLIGLDGSAEFLTLGQTGGSKTSTAQHVHTLNNHNHGATLTHDHNHDGFAGNSLGTTNHIHALDNAYAFGTSNTSHVHYIGGGPGEVSAAPQGAGRSGSTAGNTAGMSVDHVHDIGHNHNAHGNHTIGNDNSNSGASSVGATSGNLQPYRVINWFIKT